MDKKELLKNLLLLYPKGFNENNKQLWLDAYKEVIPENGIDFEKLYKLIITEHDSTAFAPSPKWVKELVTKVSVPKEKEIEQDKGELIPMPEWFRKQKKEFLKKLSIKENDV